MGYRVMGCWLFVFSFFAQGFSLTYGGLTLECDSGCHWNADTTVIEDILHKAIKEIFAWNKYSHILLDAYGNEHYVSAWEGRSGSYRTFDWEATSGRWVKGSVKHFDVWPYKSFLELAAQLEKDVHFYYRDAPRLFKKHLQDLLSKLQAGYNAGYECVKIIDGEPDFRIKILGPCSDSDLKNYIKSAQKDIEEIDSSEQMENYHNAIKLVSACIRRIDAVYKREFVFCLLNHQEEGAKFKTALECLIMGDFDGAFEQISSLIDLIEKKNLGDDIAAKLYLLKGQVQSEFCLYSDAIIALTTSIQKDPLLKESYFERAAAYFELGEFDKAIEDYLVSGYADEEFRRKPALTASVDLALGMVAGIIDGGTHSLAEFVPEMLSTFRGLSGGLWAFAQHPIDSSRAVASAAIECVKYIKANFSVEALHQVVPELKNLVQNYAELGDYEKGNLIGQIIGKYGVDIFICSSSAKVVKAYIDLKKTNQILTLDALASPVAKQKIFEEAGKRWAHREAVLKNATLKIDWDKQGKHLIDHRNYMDTKSVWSCSKEKTQELIDRFAGTGYKAHGSGAHYPGEAGYREVVDFGECIGDHISRETSIKTPTTWGIIHYAKDGVHVVPHIPRGK